MSYPEKFSDYVVNKIGHKLDPSVITDWKNTLKGNIVVQPQAIAYLADITLERCFEEFKRKVDAKIKFVDGSGTPDLWLSKTITILARTAWRSSRKSAVIRLLKCLEKDNDAVLFYAQVNNTILRAFLLDFFVTQAFKDAGRIGLKDVMDNLDIAELDRLFPWKVCIFFVFFAYAVFYFFCIFFCAILRYRYL